MIHLIDLFCGAGGVTTGVEQAQINGKKVAEVIACVNHDFNAIESNSVVPNVPKKWMEALGRKLLAGQTKMEVA